VKMEWGQYQGQPQCERSTLPNGIRVLTERLGHVDSVSLGIWVVGGAWEEPAGMEGVTHFLEHMLFKGTERRTAAEMARVVDEIGGNVNGYTERESLCLLARTVGEHTERALELLFDMLLHSVCGEEEVEREKEVVLQELRHVEDTPEDWVHDLLLEAAWGEHPLGRPLVGRRESIGRLNSEGLREYWGRRCCGDRIVVSAAGRVEHEVIAELVARHAGGQPRGGERVVAEPSTQPAGKPSTQPAGKPSTQPAGKPPEFRPGRKLVSRPTGQVHFCLATPGCGRRDEERHAFSVFDTVLGGGASSRLFQEIREKRGLVYHIGSYLQSYDGAGLLTVDAGTGPESFELVLELIEGEMEGLRREGPSAEEMERAKTQLKVGLALATESTSFRMQHLALSEIIWGRVWPFQEVVERVEGVTAEEVHALAQKCFSEGHQTLVAIGPFRLRQGYGGRVGKGRGKR